MGSPTLGADRMMYVEAALGTASLRVFNAAVALNARRAVPVIACRTSGNVVSYKYRRSY
jgi:hypothetical protein